MRQIFSLFLLILSIVSSPVVIASNNHGIHTDHPYTFTIIKDVYRFYELYQISAPQNDIYPGTIKKSAFHIRTNYDLSDKDGWQATGITRLVSMGSLYAWATDIDIYDTRGVQIAFIDGSFATLEAAKFNLYEYDEAGAATEVGIAYANADFSRFVIFPSSGAPNPIAEMNRNIREKTWDVTVHYPELIDDRLIRIFAGFVIDYQDKFLSK